MMPTIAATSAPEPIDDADQEQLAEFLSQGIDRRELRSWSSHAVDDRRDLHGLTAAEASVEVGRFIENSRHRQHRCICIVHGRGLHSKEQVAVLRTRVRELLRTDPFACSPIPTRRRMTAERAPSTCCCGGAEAES